jgi:hypothetical protein
VREPGECETEIPARVAHVDPLIAGLKLCADTQRHLAEWERRKAQASTAEDDEYVSSFAALCHAADERERSKPPDRNLERLRELLGDNVSIERAQAEINRRDRAAISTVEALMFVLRERGIAALQEQKVRACLAQLSEAQIIEVGDRLQRLEARAWSPEEVDALVSAWEATHG